MTYKFCLLTLIVLCCLSDCKSLGLGQQQPLDNEKLQGIDTFNVYLSESPRQRYREITLAKKNLIGKFIDHLYSVNHHFFIAFWLAHVTFTIVPDVALKQYFGEEYIEECKGIAFYSERTLSEIVVYNYMYELGASKDFCTSIAVSQIPSQLDSNQSESQSLGLLARNLDYGFQEYLAENTVQIHYHRNRNAPQTQGSKPAFTVLTHAGFMGSHTIMKFSESIFTPKSTPKTLQYALTLNERHSETFWETIRKIVTSRCDSVFALLMRALKYENFSQIEQLIEFLSEAHTCSNAYFIIQTELLQNCLIEKNHGVGVNKVVLQKQQEQFEHSVSTDRPKHSSVRYIVQTNTDIDLPDPDGRRDAAIAKLNQRIENQQSGLSQQDIKQILLESPNFNQLTLMTAIMNVPKGSLEAWVWGQPQNSSMA